MGLACWVWKGVEPVLYERRKINVAGGVGRETGASLSSENCKEETRSWKQLSGKRKSAEQTVSINQDQPPALDLPAVLQPFLPQ